MIEKRLGKIDFVEFGSMKDYPFQLGLQLGFSMSGSGVMDGGKYTVNMSPDCHWEIGTRHTKALIFGPDGSLSRRKSTACPCLKSVRTRRFRLIITTPLPLETGLTSGVPIENEAGYF